MAIQTDKQHKVTAYFVPQIGETAAIGVDRTGLHALVPEQKLVPGTAFPTTDIYCLLRDRVDVSKDDIATDDVIASLCRIC